MNVGSLYRERYERVLFPVAAKLQEFLQGILSEMPRVDRISTRPKSVERFIGKANATTKDGKPKYVEPLHQIQDQIGARIITFYKDDVTRISDEVQRYFHAIESKDLVPENDWEFGYFGNHHVLILPPDVVDQSFDKDLVPNCFELQIKTLFQHAWSEANHDLGYKPGLQPLESDELRQLAFTSAQAWGADRVFNELFAKRSAVRQAD
ncbi:GTP pyrophosphokinase [Paradevosia shaoguanensis]|uniref:RelA/SpoT domain-containing protein n=1 Tax=Paradevosia shaoguanensis TaxID=1335043 RepID=A0AA41UEP6_9HYPH|nr:RelA/SpoT domain-containing protein [Paradevosia shaoguanensis]MCF1744186.1 RelA/SpoT domain-containing protein [Paradevosia shaoguanensis]MCI0128669.1 RelA/SpoT domain-containing protein [Paradevosia shaoguanensis]